MYGVMQHLEKTWPIIGSAEERNFSSTSSHRVFVNKNMSHGDDWKNQLMKSKWSVYICFIQYLNSNKITMMYIKHVSYAGLLSFTYANQQNTDI